MNATPTGLSQKTKTKTKKKKKYMNDNETISGPMFFFNKQKKLIRLHKTRMRVWRRIEGKGQCHLREGLAGK